MGLARVTANETGLTAKGYGDVCDLRGVKARVRVTDTIMKTAPVLTTVNLYSLQYSLKILLPLILLLASLSRLLAGPAPDKWEAWSTRPELMPATNYNAKDRAWHIAANGKASYQGGWELQWSDIQAGKWYQFDIECQASDLPSVHDNAHAELFWWKADGKRAGWQHVRFRPGKGVLTYSLHAQAPEGAVRASARLMLRWTDHGSLTWKSPSLKQTAPPAERKIKAAIATGKFPGTSVEDNLAFSIDLIKAAAKAGADVVCLPETITSFRSRLPIEETARIIPGPETDRLGRVAREHDIDIVFSMNEIDKKGLIYNTGIYIDAKKGITGKYRKVHLSVGERWEGKTPGQTFPVWKTHYGKSGMLICYDNVHPEGHRILSQKGAEVLFLPIMGDPRAVGEHAFDKWLQIMKVRAMDNHVWYVICQNKGTWGVIIRPDGEIVAEVDPDTGMAIAEIDLNFKYKSWIGSDFENRNWGERRPNLYGELIEDH